jgi:hypothetical protein
MTARRASAYTRLIRALDEHAAAIAADDQAAIREAADVRLFARDARSESERALRSAEELLDRLVEEGRLSAWSADQLAYDLEACGPYAPPVGVSR